MCILYSVKLQMNKHNHTKFHCNIHGPVSTTNQCSCSNLQWIHKELVIQVYLINKHSFFIPILSYLNLCHTNVTICNIILSDDIMEHFWTRDVSGCYCLPRCGTNPNFIASNVPIGHLGCLPKDNCFLQNLHIRRWSRNCIITVGEMVKTMTGDYNVRKNYYS